MVLTALVLTVTSALVSPAGIVTVPGTLATALLLLVSETTAFGGAAPESDTVAVDVLPPTTELGLRTTELIAGVTRTFTARTVPL